jgi:hypothetical protein
MVDNLSLLFRENNMTESVKRLWNKVYDPRTGMVTSFGVWTTPVIASPLLIPLANVGPVRPYMAMGSIYAYGLTLFASTFVPLFY